MLSGTALREDFGKPAHHQGVNCPFVFSVNALQPKVLNNGFCCPILYVHYASELNRRCLARLASPGLLRVN